MNASQRTATVSTRSRGEEASLPVGAEESGDRPGPSPVAGGRSEKSPLAGKRMLVISPEAFFRPHGTPLSVYYRTLVAAKLGLEIDLLTYGEGQDVEIPGVRILRIPRFRALGSVDVGPSWLKAFLDGVLLLRALGLLLRNDYDFVHAHEESVFFSRFLKPIFGFRLIYDMHSRLPQQLRNFDFTESPLLIGLFRRLERTSVRHADAVITICPALAEDVKELIDDERRHFLIENTIFDEVETSTDGAAARSDGDDGAELPERLPTGREVILYAGSFEPYQGLDLLVQAFARVRRGNPAAFLCLIGGRPDQLREIRALASELGIAEDILLTERVSMGTVNACIDRAAVLVSPRIRGSNTPLKIYQQLASGVPLVATRIHAHTQVLNDDICFLADPEPEALARSLLTSLRNEDERTRRVRNARALYERRYSRPAYEAKMRDLFGLLA